MKHAVKVILIGILFSVFLASQGCKKKDDPEPSIEDKQLSLLSKTWTFGPSSSVQLDGVDQPGYTNFSLTILGTPGEGGGGYSVSGSPTPNPWPSSGTWSFGAVPETQIIRDPLSTADKLDLTYSVSTTQLQITFNFSGTGYPGGRTSNVNGQWVFILQ